MPSSEEAAAMAAATEAEDYRVWKKNTPFLYDLVISHALEWPSLTVQWLPSHRLILGTHTSDDSPNALMIADVLFPPKTAAAAAAAAAAVPLPAVEIVQTIPHDGEVNRARFMPQKPSVIATKTCGSDVHVFDAGSGPLVLRGHSAEGYGLAWSPHREGFLLSGGYDSKICLWDLGVLPEEKVMDAHQVFEAHTEAVEDVAWHVKDGNLFGSVGDDHRLMIWDLRDSSLKKAQHLIVAHDDEINSLTFSPFNEWILATASADTTIKLFDLRKFTTSLHIFSGHTGPALQVEWSPKHETILASSSEDKRVMVWDINRIGDEQNEEDAEDGPPELFFVHGGHTAKISEFSWSPEEAWVIASVAEDNILQVWQVAESIYHDDYNSQGGDDPNTPV